MSINPNTMTVGDACKRVSRQTLADARTTLAELRRFGLTPAPIIEQFVRSEWLNLIRQGRAFTAPNVVAGPANAAYAQLWNPVGSGVSLLVYTAIAFSGGANQGAQLFGSAFKGTTALTQATNLLGGQNPATGTAGAAKGLIFGGDATTEGISPNGRMLRPYYNYGATNLALAEFSSPLGFIAEFAPGQGCHFLANTTTVNLDFQFAWAEVDVSDGYP